MASITTPFTRSRLDDVFFPAMALLALAIVVTGFGHSYFFAGMMRARLPSPLVHVHAAILTAWMAVQASQPTLVAANRVDWHQRVGVVGMLVATAVPVIGILAVVGEIRRPPFDIEHGALDLAFVIAAAADFAVLAFFGLRERDKDLSAHKRLMLLATISILGPAIGRLSFVTSPTIYYLVFAILLALVITFDIASLRKVHRATFLGIALITSTQALAELFWRTSTAAGLVTWVQNA
jgi:hypothetical protein